MNQNNNKIRATIKTMKYYLRIWLLMNKNSFLIYLNNKLILGVFLLGKVLRFSFFTAFLYFLVTGAQDLAGYTVTQTLFFFLTFNLIDVISQFLFREVYRFRSYVVSGDFDLILLKPFSPLFRVLFGGADIIDLITLPPLLFAVIYFGIQISSGPLASLYYILLLFNGLLIAMAFHILVLSLGIITLEIDHSVMIFRDITKLGTIPVDVYRQPLRAVLTYIIPVGVMVSFPVKALIGLVSFWGVLLSFTLGGLLVFLSLRFWKLALTKYSSASS